MAWPIPSWLRSVFYLTRGTHVFAQRRQRLERGPGDIGISARLVHRTGRIADRGMRHAHAAIEPGAATETADHRHPHRADHGRTGDRAGVGEIEQHPAGLFKTPG